MRIISVDFGNIKPRRMTSTGEIYTVGSRPMKASLVKSNDATAVRTIVYSSTMPMVYALFLVPTNAARYIHPNNAYVQSKVYALNPKGRTCTCISSCSTLFHAPPGPQ